MTRCFTLLMKSSLIPTSVIEPARAPMPAPIAAPSSGTKKIKPNSMPQNVPPSAPAAVMLLNWRVFGFFFSDSQETTAASSILINSWACSDCNL